MRIQWSLLRLKRDLAALYARAGTRRLGFLRLHRSMQMWLKRSAVWRRRGCIWMAYWRTRLEGM